MESSFFEPLINFNREGATEEQQLFFKRYYRPEFEELVCFKEIQFRNYEHSEVYLNVPFEKFPLQITIKQVKDVFDLVENHYKLKTGTYRLCYGNTLLDKSSKHSLKKLKLYKWSVINLQFKLPITQKSLQFDNVSKFFKVKEKKVSATSFAEFEIKSKDFLERPFEILTSSNRTVNNQFRFNALLHQKQAWIGFPLQETMNTKYVHIIYTREKQNRLDLLISPKELLQFLPQTSINKQYRFVFNCNVIEKISDAEKLPFESELQLLELKEGVEFVRFTNMLSKMKACGLSESLNHLTEYYVWTARIIDMIVASDREWIQSNQVQRRTCLGIMVLYLTDHIYHAFITDIRKKNYQPWLRYLKIIYQKFYRLPMMYVGRGYIPCPNYVPSENLNIGDIFCLNNFLKFYSNEEFVSKIVARGKYSGTLIEVESHSGKRIPCDKIFAALFRPFTYFRIQEIYREFKISGSDKNYIFMRIVQLPSPKMGPHLLWADDWPSGNKANIEVVRTRTCLNLLLPLQTNQASFILKHFKWILENKDRGHFKMITDMVKIKYYPKRSWQKEEKNQFKDLYSGVDLIEMMYDDLGYESKSIVYCNNTTEANQNFSKRGLIGKYPFLVESSEYSIKKFIVEGEKQEEGRNYYRSSEQLNKDKQNDPLYAKCYLCQWYSRTRQMTNVQRDKYNFRNYICAHCMNL